jgi:hypothetical protein
VPENEDNQELADVRQANAQLEVSLQRCRQMLFQCREQLSADGNAPAAPANDQEPSG